MRMEHYAKNLRQGFTLVEILIAVSIIAIITAIALPNFTTMIAKSKLRSDIQTAGNVQNAVDLYVAEYGKSPLTGATVLEQTSAGEAIAVMRNLFENGYLKSIVTTLQTEGATLVFNSTRYLVQVDLSTAEGLPDNISDFLNPTDLAFVANLVDTTAK